MRFTNLLILKTIVLSVAFLSFADAQTQPLAQKDQAVMLLEIQMDRLADSELAKALNLRDQITSNTGNIDPRDIVRIFAMASAPESVDEIEGMQNGNLPVEFLMVMQLKDESAAEKAMNELTSEGAESFQRNGKTFYRPNDPNAPDNVVASRIDSTTIQMGSETYAFMPNSMQALSAGLQQAWGKVSQGNDAIRIVIDLDGARHLIDEALDMAAGQGDPMLQGFLEVIPGIKDLAITMDFSGGNLLGMIMNCKDSESAEQLNDALNGIFSVAKMFGGPAINEMRDQDPELARVAQSLLRALTPSVDGSVVEVKIPKPEGMEGAVKNAMENFGMGFGGMGYDDDY